MREETRRFFSVCIKTVFKMRPLLPTLKEKKRYLVFEIISRDKLKDFRFALEEVKSKIKDFLGILVFARAGIQILKHNNQRVLLRVGHRYVDHVKSALMFVKSLDNQPIIIKSVGVSGILKKADTNYLV